MANKCHQPPSHDYDPHHHVCKQGAGPEDHVQGHGDVKVKRVVVDDADQKVHGHQRRPGLRYQEVSKPITYQP